MKRLPDYLVIILVLLSALVRYPRMLNRLLWGDEAWRALVIFSGDSFTSLLEYTDSYYGFTLFTEWILGRFGIFLFGKTEIAFRLWPFLALLASIVGMYLFVRKISNSWVALLAAFFIAFSPSFIRHSTDFKPYMIDLAFTCWTLFLSVPKDNKWQRINDLSLLVVLNIFAISSIVFVFVFPAIAVYRLFHLKKRSVFDIITVSVPIVCFVCTYFFFLSPQMTGNTAAYLNKYWGKHYLTSLSNLRFIMSETQHWLDGFFMEGSLAVLFVYFLVSPAVSLKRRDGAYILLVGPLIVHTAFSVFGKYPFLDRPSCYLYGIFIASFSYGLDGLIRYMNVKTNRISVASLNVIVVALLIICLAFLQSLPSLVYEAAKAQPNESTCDPIRTLGKRFQPGDVIKLSYSYDYAFYFYRDTLLSHLNKKVIPERDELNRFHRLGDKTPNQLCQYLKLKKKGVQPGNRVWFLTFFPQAPFYYPPILSQIGTVEIACWGESGSLLLLIVEKPVGHLSCESEGS